MTAAQTSPRRQMSPRAAEALERGRQRRAANLAAQREQQEQEQAETLREEAEQQSPSETPAASSSATPSRQASASQASPIDSSPGSQAGSTPSANDLRVIFDDTPVDQPRQAATQAAGKQAKHTVNRAAGRASSAPRSPVASPSQRGAPAKGQTKAAPPWIDEREEKVRYHAAQDAPTLGKMLIAAATWLIDSAAAPSEDLAADMATPALRLLYRNLPSLMEMSPNAKDGGELLMAVAVWSSEVAEWRKERQISRGDRRVRNAPGASGYAPYPIRNGAAPADSRAYGPTAAGQQNGYDADPARDPRAAYGAGSADTGSAGASATQVFADLGIAL